MRVLLSGYYGFGNLGDEAILRGLHGALSARGFEVAALSSDPAATEREHAGLGAAGLRARSRLLGVPRALLACDALVSGGGGLLQDRTSRRSLQYYLGLVRLARRLGKSAVVYGQSVGPLSAEGRRRVARALAGLPVAVRDEASQALLAELGIKAALTADAALLLNAPAVPRGDAPLDTTLIIPRGGYPEVTGALEVVARGLLAAGRAVAVSSVQSTEDAPEVARLLAAAPGLEHWRALNVDDLLEHAARAAYLVSGRLHGLILAAVAGTDFAGLVYDPKVRAFLAEAGAPAFELPADAGALLATALERPRVPPERVLALKQRAEEGVAWLAGVLHSSRSDSVGRASRIG